MTAPREDWDALATEERRQASSLEGRAELERCLDRRSSAERSAFWKAVGLFYASGEADALVQDTETVAKGNDAGPQGATGPGQGAPQPASAGPRAPGGLPLTARHGGERTMLASRAFFAFAGKVAKWAGHPLAFAAGISIVVGWAVSGPYFGYSETWQLVINTSTTIVTFLMVFLIQNSQNRDGAAIQAKLDELIRASAAQNHYIGIENLTEEELDELRQRCETRARAERLDNAREAADEAEARVHDKAACAAERMG